MAKRYILLLLNLVFILLMVECKPAIKSNHDILTKMGLQRVRPPNSHHRKRLAIESRHHARSDDSHIFIVKLPPNPHYYVHNTPPNAISEYSNEKSIGFKGNGKLNKVYHWNIPTLKKIVKKKKLQQQFDFDVEDPASWNDVLDKPSSGRQNLKPIYYVPSGNKPKKAVSTSFHKYFPGNGKPHSFYVIERSKKAHYHRLMP